MRNTLTVAALFIALIPAAYAQQNPLDAIETGRNMARQDSAQPKTPHTWYVAEQGNHCTLAVMNGVRYSPQYLIDVMQRGGHMISSSVKQLPDNNLAVILTEGENDPDHEAWLFFTDRQQCEITVKAAIAAGYVTNPDFLQ